MTCAARPRCRSGARSWRCTAASAVRGLRDLAEFLQLAPIAFTLIAAAAFALVAGASVATIAPYLAAVLLTQLSIALHNDWCDRVLDAEGKPWRWIPRGVVDARLALAAAIVLGAAGIGTAFVVSAAVGALVAAGTSCGYIYNAWLKRTPFSWAPFAVALPTLAICSLAVADRVTRDALVVYVIAVPLVLAIHLADALPDIEGDRRARSRGLAVVLGTRGALLTCWTGMLVAIVLASVLRPHAIAPGPLVLASAALLVLAVAISRVSLRAHLYLIFASAVALAIDYVAAITAR